MVTARSDFGEQERLVRRIAGMQRLVTAVEELSLARALGGVQVVVRRAARELTGADGATFVLREVDKCFYADEDAIAPLWKGQSFPMESCVSGWAMMNREPAVIEDIYQDPRVPIDAYRPTFVKSMVMVPIRTEAPIGAIGNYWASRHRPTADEVELLQALANTTAVALESVRLYTELEQRVSERTRQLEDANHDLEAFAASVSHDLRSPLARISGFAQLLQMNGGSLHTKKERECVEQIVAGTKDAAGLIDDLLRLARFSKADLRVEDVDLTAMAEETVKRLRAAEAQREVQVVIEPGMRAHGDRGLLRAAVENLLSNAWKYSGRMKRARIEFRSAPGPDGTRTFMIKDNGAGFDMAAAKRLFEPFQRMHAKSEFQGHGVGLATVQRIVQRHGGRIWAEARPGKGATFWFALPDPRD